MKLFGFYVLGERWPFGWRDAKAHYSELRDLVLSIPDENKIIIREQKIDLINQIFGAIVGTFLVAYELYTRYPEAPFSGNVFQLPSQILGGQVAG
jgi:hypothetical protein